MITGVQKNNEMMVNVSQLTSSARLCRLLVCICDKSLIAGMGLWKTDRGRTDGRTDGQTDGWTDRPTD